MFQNGFQFKKKFGGYIIWENKGFSFSFLCFKFVCFQKGDLIILEYLFNVFFVKGLIVKSLDLMIESIDVFVRGI